MIGPKVTGSAAEQLGGDGGHCCESRADLRAGEGMTTWQSLALLVTKPWHVACGWMTRTAPSAHLRSYRPAAVADPDRAWTGQPADRDAGATCTRAESRAGAVKIEGQASADWHAARLQLPMRPAAPAGLRQQPAGAAAQRSQRGLCALAIAAQHSDPLLLGRDRQAVCNPLPPPALDIARQPRLLGDLATPRLPLSRRLASGRAQALRCQAGLISHRQPQSSRRMVPARRERAADRRNAAAVSGRLHFMVGRSGECFDVLT